LTQDEALTYPETVLQAERFLEYVHLNRIELTPDKKLIAGESLREIVRLIDPLAARFAEQTDERHYLNLYFLDTLLRFSGMINASNGKLSVMQYGYLYLSRAAEKRLVMLVSAFVNDYPPIVLFPRGDLAHKLSENWSAVMEFVLNQKADAALGIASFADSLSALLPITFTEEKAPYEQLTFEWVVRHSLIYPLYLLGLCGLLDEEKRSVKTIKEARQFALTAAGLSILKLREVSRSASPLW